MDENDILTPQEEPEFTLEDIMREFGSGSDDGRVYDDVTPELLEDIPQLELLEDAPMAEHLTADEEPELLTWTPRAHAAPAADLSDTQAFAPVTTASAGDTQRIDTAKVLAATAPRGGVSDETQPFTPVGDSAGTPEAFRANPIPQGAEPFSANWEPEYDQPIGEYTPPEPIIFRPKNRLGELTQ